MAQVRLDRVAKQYGATLVLEPLDLLVRDGEFLTLLGSSGCGKTTTLRLIAGFIAPSAGRIRIGEQDVTDLPPQKREIGMVFQDYALFPHLTIAENIGFGLVERRVNRRVIAQRVSELLNLIRLPGLENRYPSEISGGQQQRVAVARAVAHAPLVLLMDEPLGALDLKLRETMQFELRRIQQELRITTVYVTHDQTEAMTMSDRIVVMNHGRIEQSGTAREIYSHPSTRFVAGFVGKINLFEGRAIAHEAGQAIIEGAGGRVRCAVATPVAQPTVWLALRPESLRLVPQHQAVDAVRENRLLGRIRTKVFVGNAWNVIVDMDGGAEWLVEMRGDAEFLQDGAVMAVTWPCGTGTVLQE
jgi:spermidine/putrescine ABC transporter ATP-binding subunit